MKKVGLVFIIAFSSLLAGCSMVNNDEDSVDVLISAGDQHTVIINDAGDVLSWGASLYGVLGNDESNADSNYATPLTITDAFDFEEGDTLTHLSSGNNHTLALVSDGRIFGWGHNLVGQVGDLEAEIVRVPTDITESFNLNNDEVIVDIVSEQYNVALTSTGRVFVWGSNHTGGLAHQSTSDNQGIPHEKVPVDITDYFVLEDEEVITSIGINKVLTSDGRVFVWGDVFLDFEENDFHPKNITSDLSLENDETIKKIFSDNDIILTSNDRVLVLGVKSTLGQTGSNGKQIHTEDITEAFNFDANETLKFVTQGNTYTILVSTQNRVFAWGENTYGQLGDGTTDFVVPPFFNENATEASILSITDHFDFESEETITAISAGGNHTLLLTSHNRVFTWGRNHKGQLGNRSFDNQLLPVEITEHITQNQQDKTY